MFEYKDFVEEIRLLTEQGKNLLGAALRDQDPEFRKWRIKLEELLRIIQLEKYTINCQSPIRRYGGGHMGFVTNVEKVRNDQFNQDVSDTLNELSVILDHYDKYSEPSKRTKPKTELEPGHIPTVKELFLSLKANHGYKTLVVIIGFLIAIISGAFYIGILYERYSNMNDAASTKKVTANQTLQPIRHRFAVPPS